MNGERDTKLIETAETLAVTRSGYGMLGVTLVSFVIAIASIFFINSMGAPAITLLVAGTLIGLFILCGFYFLNPNQVAAIQLFG